MKPPFLRPNDEIRIISPSGCIQSELIEGAKKVLGNWGLRATEGDFARAEYGRFAGTKDQRISDLQNALDNPDVKAILCSRGGYGLAQVIDNLDFTQFEKTPKWLIGFSDISILHSAITNLGIASIHGNMVKAIAELPSNSEPVEGLRQLLFGQLPSYTIVGHKMNKQGSACGKLIGGNLSVLMGLRGTNYDLQFANNILFIEEIAEQPYHIDRMMQNLRLGGGLAKLSGLVVGQFSDCFEDPKMKQTVVEIILAAVSEYHFPVCFDFPAGHVDYNLALIFGSTVQLHINANNATLTF